MVSTGNALATYGRWQTYLGTLVTTIFILCMMSCLMAGAWDTHQDVHTVKIPATLSNNACRVLNKNSTQCDAIANYTVNGTAYHTAIQYNGPGVDSKQVYYNPSNPADAIGEQGSVGFDIGICVLLCVFLLFMFAGTFLVHKSKTAAQVAGASGLLDMLFD